MTEGASPDIATALQPVLSPRHRRVVGYEALVRGLERDGETPISPVSLFRGAETDEALIELEGDALRSHMTLFSRKAASQPMWLFVNMNPRLIEVARYRELVPAAIKEAGLAPHRVVVQMVESASETGAIEEAVTHFRSLGTLIALDDFGTGHSNFERLWTLAPDLVKLDRSLLAHGSAESEKALRHILPNLVRLMHEAGSLVVLEGVESQQHGLAAADADVDFVQGFHFGKPSLMSEPGSDSVERVREITHRFSDHLFTRMQEEETCLRPYRDAFARAAESLKHTGRLAESCGELLRLSGMQRCYMLDARASSSGNICSGRARRPP